MTNDYAANVADASPGELRIRIEEERLDAQTEARARLAAKGFEPPPYFKTLADQLAREREETAQRVARLWDVGTDLLLQAKHKTGKTTTTANLLRSLADGEPFLGELEVIPPDGRVA